MGALDVGEPSLPTSVAEVAGTVATPQAIGFEDGVAVGRQAFSAQCNHSPRPVQLLRKRRRDHDRGSHCRSVDWSTQNAEAETRVNRQEESLGRNCPQDGQLPVLRLTNATRLPMVAN